MDHHFKAKPLRISQSSYSSSTCVWHHTGLKLTGVPKSFGRVCKTVQVETDNGNKSCSIFFAITTWPSTPQQACLQQCSLMDIPWKQSYWNDHHQSMTKQWDLVIVLQKKKQSSTQNRAELFKHQISAKATSCWWNMQQNQGNYSLNSTKNTNK